MPTFVATVMTAALVLLVAKIITILYLLAVFLGVLDGLKGLLVIVSWWALQAVEAMRELLACIGAVCVFVLGVARQ